MSLPYDPHNTEAVVVAPLMYSGALKQKGGRRGNCSRCGYEVWLNAVTAEFIDKNEVEAICPDCAQQFTEGMDDKRPKG